MRNKETGFFEILFHFGCKNFVVIIFVILLVALTLSEGCAAFYKSVKESISLQSQLNAKQSAEEFNSYMISSTNSIQLTAYALNGMIKANRPAEEILKFLTIETNNIRNSVDENFTGLYGWINGHYLDGSGWIPDEDFVPTERPWYTTTFAHDSKIVYIKPYVDAETQNVMMTLSMLLRDGKSVVALDISLDRLQKIITKVAEDNEDERIMLLDYDGDVVVHSNIKSFDESNSSKRNLFNIQIARKVFEEKQRQFYLNFDGKKYIIYAEELNGGWFTVSAINATKVFRPLYHILGSSAFAILITAIIILVVFVNITRKNILTRNLNVRIQTISDIYESMIDIDVKKNCFTCIRSTKQFENIIGLTEENAQQTLNEAVNRFANEVSKLIILKFMDFSTLDERLNGTNTITEEFLNTDGMWSRGRFIAAERKDDGSISRVLFVVESIDKEKRHRDELKHLSETDSLTNINNRGSGEYKISELLSKNESGMFILLDVDHFKSINDVYGHNTGDKVLISIANSLKRAFRSGDIIMRLGGDEFVAFAVGVTSPEVGMNAITRLFKNIEAIEINELGDRKICVSVGAYCHDGKNSMNFMDLYKLADHCTYKSKKKDGNAITFYE